MQRCRCAINHEVVDCVPRPVEYVLASRLAEANEALHTIAVDISKHETDSDGLVWRVKLAHETSQALDAALPSPSSDLPKETR